MNILISGVAGFVGSHLAKKLTSLGHKVCGMDTNELRARTILKGSVPFYRGDYGMQISLTNIIKQENVELVVQCAGHSIVDESVSDPMKYYVNNIAGNIFFLDSLIRTGVTKFLYISSATVFGEVDKMPISMNTKRDPISPLGQSQLAMENALASLHTSNNLTYAIIRATNVAGISEIEHDFFKKHLGQGLIPNIIRQILGKNDPIQIFGTTYNSIDGTAERDYIHIDDLCDACVNTVQKMVVTDEKLEFNIGSGNKYSVKEVISTAEQVFGKKILTTETSARAGDQSRTYYDHFTSRNILDWRPKYDSLEKILLTFLPCLKTAKN